MLIFRPRSQLSKEDQHLTRLSFCTYCEDGVTKLLNQFNLMLQLLQREKTPLHDRCSICTHMQSETIKPSCAVQWLEKVPSWSLAPNKLVHTPQSLGFVWKCTMYGAGLQRAGAHTGDSIVCGGSALVGTDWSSLDDRCRCTDAVPVHVCPLFSL